jgi:phospholipid/cholesterol/gamma-HCH transport system substrate-binding protein
MSNFSPEAKVGVFVVIAVIILGYMSMKVGKLSFSGEKGYDLHVIFDSATGLAPDVPVEIAGVEIGRVGSISLKNGKALVVLRFHPDIVIRQDAKAIIRTRGILGDKFVEIVPGMESSPVMKPGERIVRTAPVTDMDVLMNTLGEVAQDIKVLTHSLSNVIGGEEREATLIAIVENVKQMTEALNQTIRANQEEISAIVDNLSHFSETIKDIGDQNKDDIRHIINTAREMSGTMEMLVADLSEITDKINQGKGSIGKLINEDDTVRSLNETLASLNEITEKIKQGEGTLGQLIVEDDAIRHLNDTLASLDSITGKIGRGEGSIGRLIHDDETVETLNTTLDNLNSYLEKQETFRTYLDYRGEYLFESEALKSYFTLRIQPREDKYYLLQLVDDPAGEKTETYTATTVKNTTTEEHEVVTEMNTLKFSAQVAKRYFDMGLRGGFFESTGGVALDYYLLDDRLVFSLEAFDWDPDKNPHLKAKVDFSPFSHLYVTSGFDDFISKDDQDSFFIGAGLNISDEDIKTIIMSAPLP